MSGSIIKFSALCALLCCLVSCAALEKLVTAPAYAPIDEQLTDEWFGRADTDIVLAYGTPNRVIDDGLGGFVYVYEEVHSELAASSNSRPLVYRTYTEFYLDTEKTCYNVRSNRLAEDGRRFSPLRTIGTTAVATGLVYAIVALCL